MGTHRFAAATALATFCLLVLGGLVSTTGSGLACPDWPLCEGELIPPMVEGKQFEHTHRLAAAFVGAMTFGLCALLFKHRRQDRLLTSLGVLASALVVVQAMLGATTVWLKLPWWASSAHLATSMAFFGLMVTLTFLTRPERRPGPEQKLAPWLLPVLGLTFLQLAVGGAMRHLRAGLSCGTDLPLCLGQVWPLIGDPGVQVHLAHRALGLVVGAAVLWLAAWLWRQPAASRALRLAGLAAVGLVLVQIALGVLTVLWLRELVTMTLHSSAAAALFGVLTGMYWLALQLPAKVEAGVGV